MAMRPLTSSFWPPFTLISRIELLPECHSDARPKPRAHAFDLFAQSIGIEPHAQALKGPRQAHLRQRLDFVAEVSDIFDHDRQGRAFGSLK